MKNHILVEGYYHYHYTSTDDFRPRPQECVCGSCATSDIDKRNYCCKNHGTNYLVYKCKFCCGIATRFLWGNTHFCERCAQRQHRGDYLNRKPVSTHPQVWNFSKIEL